MSNNKILPLSIQSANYGNYDSRIVISTGSNSDSYVMSYSKSNLYWVMIFDRTTLKPVVNTTFSTNDVVPSEIAKYADDNTKIIVVCTHLLSSPNLPQGAWAKFLYAQGSSTALTRLENVYEAFNCGNFGALSYIYVAILGDIYTDGFDQSLVLDSVNIMTLQLQNFGTTMYSPTTLTVPN